MIFRNARIIFPDGIHGGLEVETGNGRIVAIRTESSTAGRETVDLGKSYLAPGFVDLHIHGALGRDTMEATADAFRTICNYHASGGTTSLLLTTATAPIKAILDVVKAARRTATKLKQIAGVHVEGPYLSKSK